MTPLSIRECLREHGPFRAWLRRPAVTVTVHEVLACGARARVQLDDGTWATVRPEGIVRPEVRRHHPLTTWIREHLPATIGELDAALRAIPEAERPGYTFSLAPLLAAMARRGEVEPTGERRPTGTGRRKQQREWRVKE